MDFAPSTRDQWSPPPRRALATDVRVDQWTRRAADVPRPDRLLALGAGHGNDPPVARHPSRAGGARNGHRRGLRATVHRAGHPRLTGGRHRIRTSGRTILPRHEKATARCAGTRSTTAERSRLEQPAPQELPQHPLHDRSQRPVLAGEALRARPAAAPPGGARRAGRGDSRGFRGRYTRQLISTPSPGRGSRQQAGSSPATARVWELRAGQVLAPSPGEAGPAESHLPDRSVDGGGTSLVSVRRSPEVAVDALGGLAALGDRPHHERLAAAHVARGEDAGYAGALPGSPSGSGRRSRAWRPSAIAHTTSDWPRRMSPAAKTPARSCSCPGRPRRCRGRRA